MSYFMHLSHSAKWQKIDFLYRTKSHSSSLARVWVLYNDLIYTGNRTNMSRVLAFTTLITREGNKHDQQSSFDEEQRAQGALT